MNAASEDDSADDVVSPVKRGRKRLVDSDDDNDDLQPGQYALIRSFVHPVSQSVSQSVMLSNTVVWCAAS